MHLSVPALLLFAGACDAFMAPTPMYMGVMKSAAIRRPACLSLKMGAAMPPGSQNQEQPQRKKSFWSRNVPDVPRSRKYYEIEERGEFLAGPDRSDEWGEELTEIGKWQRTDGPIYIQGSGGALVVGGFFNYFALQNMASASSSMWAAGIFVALLGFALQRKTSA